MRYGKRVHFAVNSGCMQFGPVLSTIYDCRGRLCHWQRVLYALYAGGMQFGPILSSLDHYRRSVRNRQ